MSLPASRNTTYSPSDPVKSADLNAIQDQIVGAKHPALSIALGAAAFLPKAGGNASLGDGQWTFGAVSTLQGSASARIPVGTRITTIEWFYNRGGAGNITVNLRKRNLRTGAAAADIATNTDNTGAALEAFLMTVNYTVEADYEVWLEVTCDNAAHVFEGAIVSTDRL